MDLQRAMRTRLESLGLPYKQVEVYGSQIVITCASFDAANRWAPVLAKFATVKRAALQSIDYLKADEHLSNRRRTIKVWRTYATIS